MDESQKAPNGPQAGLAAFLYFKEVISVEENLFKDITLEEARERLRNVSKLMDETIKNTQIELYNNGEKRLHQIAKSDIWSLARDVLETIHCPEDPCLVTAIDQRVEVTLRKLLPLELLESLEVLCGRDEHPDPPGLPGEDGPPGLTKEQILNMQNWNNWIETTSKELKRDREVIKHNEEITKLQIQRLEIDLKRANLSVTRYNQWRKSLGLDEVVTPW